MSTLVKLVKDLAEPSDYKDRSFEGNDQDYQQLIARSTTLYIGNLSFYTTEEQLYEYFGNFGPVKRVIMGLDAKNKTSCGFAFVEYFLRCHAVDCKRFTTGLKLDDRFIRVDWDYGFREGRQFGRGKSGGQVRDEYRSYYDPGRGGAAKIALESDAKRSKGSRYFEENRHGSTEGRSNYESADRRNSSSSRFRPERADDE